MFRTFLSRGLILLVICLLGIGILQTSGQSGSITGTVSLLPTTWDTQWLNQTTGTIRCYIGNLSGGSTVSQIIPSSIRLNNTVPLYNNTSRIRPSQAGFTGAVLEGAFLRPEALASLGWVVPGRSYPVVISGQFQDQVPFSCTAQIVISGSGLVDNTTPVITITGVSNNQCTASNVVPVITAADQYLNVVTITMDGQAFISGTTVSTEGNHALHVAASDQAGNNTVRDVSFTIDQSNPVITISGVIEGECRAGNVTPAIAISDACLGVTTITLNGQPYISGTPIASDGNYLLQVEASDLSGHTASQDINFIIDQTAPIASSNVTDGQVSSTSLQIFAQCTDANPAGSVLTIDGQVVADGATLSVDGTYQIVVTCTDCAGNSGQYQATVTIQSQTSTDTEIPGIFITAPENNSKTNNPQPTITITYKDQESGINQSSLIATLNGESIAGQFNLNADGGSYQPGQALANGAYTLNVSIADNAGNSNSASCSFEIDVARPTETTRTGYIQGVVYSENMQSPLVEALVTGRDSLLQTLAGRILTDSLGRFSYPTPGQGKYYIDITKPGYTYAQRQAEVVTDQPVGVDAIVLLPFDPAVTTITPSGGSHVSSDGHVVIEFPSGAVSSPINVIATEVDSAFQLPSALPANSVFTYCFELEPHGQVFNIPVTVKVNNYLGFSPGDSIPVGIFSPELGEWQHMTMAYVDASGDWLEYQTTRFSNHDINAVGRSRIIENVLPEPDECRENNDSHLEHGIGCSKYAFQSGNLMVDVDLPAIATLGAPLQLKLAYNSNTTHPTIVVNKNVRMKNHCDTGGCSYPDFVGMKLNVAGVVTEHFFDWIFLLSNQSAVARFAESRSLKDENGEWLATGRYPYDLGVSGYMYDDEYYFTNWFGGEPLTRSNVAMRAGVIYSWYGFGKFRDFVIVNNQRKSVFGGGWGIEGLYSIIASPGTDGSLPLSLSLANGSSQLLEFSATDSVPGAIDRDFISTGYRNMKIRAEIDQGMQRHYVLKSTDGSVRDFDELGRMVRVTLPNNIVYLYSYDDAGRLLSITDPLGRLVRFSYDNLGRLESIVDQAGRQTIFEVNDLNELTAITFPDGSAKRFEYEDQLMVRRIEEDGFATEYTFQDDRLHQVINPTCCGTSTLTIVPSNTQNLANDIPAGSGTIQNPARYLPATANWDLLIGARGDTTRMRSNANGQIIYRIDPLFYPTQSEYDEAGLLVRSIAPDRSVSQFSYDSTGQLIRYIDPVGATSSYEYSYNNDYQVPRLVRAVDPNGQITRFEYDNRGNRISSENALGEITHFEYDSLGFLVRSVNPQNDSTLFRYDSRYNLVSVISPVGDSIVMEYDSIGNVVAKTDMNGNRTTNQYDIMSRLTASIDPAGNVTNYDYDARGNLIRIIDANGSATIYSYDGKGHLVQTTDPLGYVSKYEYDLAGNLVLEITPKGDSITYAYDLLDRVVRKAMPEDAMQYSYDIGGRLSSIATGSSVSAFNYDLRGKVVSTSGNSGVRLSYSYDAAGNQIEAALSKNESPFDAGVSYGAGTNPRAVVAADLNKDGAVDLVVSNATTNNLSIALNLGDGTFAPSYPVATASTNLREAVAADLDNDGNIDLAVAGLGTTGLSLLFGAGDGTFGAPILIPQGSASRTIEARDFDLDGDLDLAVSVSDPVYCVKLFRNEGNRQFALANSVEYPAAGASYVIAEDLDRDNVNELIVGSSTSANVLIFKDTGLGNMTFESSPTVLSLPQLGFTLAAAAGDLNGDRYPDLVFITASTSRDSLAVIFNLGDGTFGNPVLYRNEFDARDVIARDFNGDGTIDVASVGPVGYMSSLTLWTNDGAGNLTVVSKIPSGKQPTWMCSADLDGNGVPDIATANIVTDMVEGKFAIHLNPGTVRSTHSQNYSLGPATSGGYDQLITNIATGDWNNDGFPDIATTRANRNDVAVLMSLGAGAFDSVINLPFAGAVNDVATGDFDSDGIEDLVVAAGYGITVFSGFNGSSFSTRRIDTYGMPYSIAVADMDGDTFADDVIMQIGTTSIIVLYSDNPFDPPREVEIPVADYPNRIVAVDLDSDGDQDIAFTANGGNNVTLISNLGIDGFEVGGNAILPTGAQPSRIHYADLDRDGDQDLVVTYWFTSAETKNISVFRNLGGGTFGPQETIVASQDWATDAALIDYDRDGFLDLLINDWWVGETSVFANINGGSFVEVNSYCSGASSYCLAVADFDGDGRSDYAVGDYFGNTVTVVFNSFSGKPIRQRVSRTVDELNRVSGLEATNSGLANPISFAWAYDNLGRPTTMTTNNGLSTQYAFDKKNRLLELSYAHNGQPIESFSYTYDPNGNRISRTDHYGTRNYGYDQLNQLISAVQPAPLPQESYNYDPLGNRVTSHLSQQHAHDAGNRLLEDDQFTYEYDANGNLVLQTGKTNGIIKEFTFNAENQLVGFEEHENGTLQTSASYTYDGLGRRVAKAVNGIVTRFVYDDEDIVLELDGQDSVRAYYIHGSGIDNPLAMVRSDQVYSYVKDGLGSIAVVVDTSGNTVAEYLYDSYGNIKQKLGALANPYSYTAREHDAETGLFYYRARYYDATAGRFLSGDPIWQTNLFKYVRNNPLNWIDPSGLKGTEVDVSADEAFAQIKNWESQTSSIGQWSQTLPLGGEGGNVFPTPQFSNWHKGMTYNVVNESGQRTNLEWYIVGRHHLLLVPVIAIIEPFRNLFDEYWAKKSYDTYNGVNWRSLWEGIKSSWRDTKVKEKTTNKCP